MTVIFGCVGIDRWDNLAFPTVGILSIEYASYNGILSFLLEINLKKFPSVDPCFPGH
jgi:hypothetical protein